MPGMAMRKDGKKFMWDGGTYATEAEAKQKMSQYQNDKFEVAVLSEEGKHWLYTRRLVTEIVLEEGGKPL